MHHERDFCGWLRQARHSADLTQEALAEAVGCAAQTLRSFESGRRRPSREMAARIAEILQIPPAERDVFIRLARARPAIPGQPAADSGEQARQRGAAGPLEGGPGGGAALARLEAPAQAEHSAPPLVFATKLFRPQPDADVVRRQRLFDRLDLGLSRPLTLIAAPAGFGKATLISTRSSRCWRAICPPPWPGPTPAPSTWGTPRATSRGRST